MRDDWNDVLYRRVYDEIHLFLAERRRCGESAQAMRDRLEWAYVASGVNLAEKGEVCQVTQDATIAAYEAFLAAWEEEEAKEKEAK